MKERIKTQKYLFSKRAKIMTFLQAEGYTGEQIGQIFNIDKSRVSRLLAKEKIYKGLVKSMLSDKRAK